MDQLPRLGKRELICLLLFTCNYVVSVWRGFLFLWALVMGCVILLWHSLGLPYGYFSYLYTSVVVQPGLCLTWSKPPKTGFLMMRLVSCTCLLWLRRTKLTFEYFHSFVYFLYLSVFPSCYISNNAGL